MVNITENQSDIKQRAVQWCKYWAAPYKIDSRKIEETALLSQNECFCTLPCILKRQSNRKTIISHNSVHKELFTMEYVITFT